MKSSCSPPLPPSLPPSNINQVAARHERPLKPFDKILPYYVNTMDDPNLERYAAEEFAGQVFATDAVLAHLMTCGRSVSALCNNKGGREGNRRV